MTFCVRPDPMAQRHWLDPLARQLLIASGRLRPDPDAAPRRRPAGRPDPQQQAERERREREEAIERDLLALQLAHQPSRPLRDAEEVRRAAALGWRLDVNRATAADWLRLPGCRSEQADLLLRLQAGGVQLSGPEDLQRLLRLEADQLRCWLPLLQFRWYGSAPEPAAGVIAINSAAPDELRRLPELGAVALERLLAERRRRPFRDLADLQQRLGLPAPLIEAWIGRVSFEPPPPGPRLPPSPRRR